MMKVTQVSIRPSDASEIAGRPSLTPELLAASGARYSRNNEGLSTILAKIDPENLDKSVDNIFKMIDYGHQSIADMAPVAMFIDSVSIWMAYYVWSLCPTAGGQESSTRYIKISVDGLIPPEKLGIPEPFHEEWNDLMKSSFKAYQAGLSMWETTAERYPDISRIPKSLLDDKSEKTQKQVVRMKRNFAFDRSRYFLPVAARTNLMLMMSARGWVQLTQHLLSHFLPEARELGDLIRSELILVVPRLTKHAEYKEYLKKGIEAEFSQLVLLATHTDKAYLKAENADASHPVNAKLVIQTPEGVNGSGLAGALSFHENRYALAGQDLKRTVVRFSWEAVALAEIRDLNRHRTGSKYCPMVPCGFYCADDQIPQSSMENKKKITELMQIGRQASLRSLELLMNTDKTYVYWGLLGTQYSFEHVTTADKFIYEAELRTGAGAHYRYASHIRDVLQLWYTRYPETKGYIIEGSFEPE